MCTTAASWTARYSRVENWLTVPLAATGDHPPGDPCLEGAGLGVRVRRLVREALVH